MSRDIRPNRTAARDYPPPARSKYEEYEDEYPAVSRYFPQEDTGRSGRGYDDQRRPSQRDNYNDSGRYGQSASTTSGSGSSLIDRMKVKSYDAPARTSVDDDRAYETPRQSAATWARKPGMKQPQARHQVPEEREPISHADDPSSAGNTLWGRVVTAAGSLTVNVSKAWESGPGDGPETPPGGESRLTKAMKAYYLERARAPIDLPHWLFDEHERMPTRHTAAVTRNDRMQRRNPYDDYEDDPTPAPAPPRGALRDVYDRAASNTGAPRKPVAPSSYAQSDTGTGESKAVSRLRAMRDAKRAAAGTTTTSNKYDEEYDGGRRSMEPATDNERRNPRVGLPTRPGGRYN